MDCFVRMHARIGKAIIDPSDGTTHSDGGFEVQGEMIVFLSVISMTLHISPSIRWSNLNVYDLLVFHLYKSHNHCRIHTMPTRDLSMVERILRHRRSLPCLAKAHGQGLVTVLARLHRKNPPPRGSQRIERVEWFRFLRLESPSIILTKSSREVSPMSKRKAVPEFPACKTLGERLKP